VLCTVYSQYNRLSLFILINPFPSRFVEGVNRFNSEFFMVIQRILFALVCLSPVLVFANAKPNGSAPQVVVAKVESRSVVEVIDSLGNLVPNEAVELNASVTERVVSLHFEDGEQVEKGQVLVRLNSAEEEASLRELKIATEDAKRQYERFLPLFRRGDVSQSILDERKREWDLARAKEAVLEARVDKLTIRAPFSGRVGAREISLGALLTPSQRITRLQDSARMKLDFSVPTRFLNELQPGHRIEATTDAYPNEVFVGEIETIMPQIDTLTRTFQVRGVLPNAQGRLYSGMLMKVRLQQAPREALFIPETAIVPIAEKHFVYVLNLQEGGLAKLVRREVTLGMRQPGWVEVVEGLKQGQVVVSEGALRVRPGMEVKPLDALKRLSDTSAQGE
jgi:membrane fusion protein (multidrug efflux system)